MKRLNGMEAYDQARAIFATLADSIPPLEALDKSLHWVRNNVMKSENDYCKIMLGFEYKHLYE